MSSNPSRILHLAALVLGITGAGLTWRAATSADASTVRAPQPTVVATLNLGRVLSGLKESAAVKTRLDGIRAEVVAWQQEKQKVLDQMRENIIGMPEGAPQVEQMEIERFTEASRFPQLLLVNGQADVIHGLNRNCLFCFHCRAA